MNKEDRYDFLAQAADVNGHRPDLSNTETAKINQAPEGEPFAYQNDVLEFTDSNISTGVTGISQPDQPESLDVETTRPDRSQKQMAELTLEAMELDPETR